MSEQKVVKCRCGKDMHPYHGQYYSGCRYWARYECECGWCAPLIVGDTADEAIEVAYLAATPTPPNRPMTREQVEAMDDLDAVWIAHYCVTPEMFEQTPTIMLAREIKRAECKMLGFAWLYAKRPTPADIEAARKEHGHYE